MKQHLLAAGILLAAIPGFAQEKQEQHEKSVKAPAAAQAAFKKAYPAVTNEKWTKEDGNYEANFKQGATAMSVIYNASGALQETEEAIAQTALPANATAYVKQHYKKPVKEVEKVTKANGDVCYEVEIGDKEAVFDKDGKFIKEQED